MAALRTLCLLLGALAAVSLGVLSAVPAEAAAPCHDPVHGSAPAPEVPAHPDKPIKAVECCVACVVAATPAPPPRGALILPAPVREIAPVALPTGLRPAPEPHPPRRTNA